MARIHKRTTQKDLHDPDNYNGVITHLEPDILEYEVKWALEGITTNKARRWWNSSWAISNAKRWCCESAVVIMPANFENSGLNELASMVIIWRFCLKYYWSLCFSDIKKPLHYTSVSRVETFMFSIRFLQNLETLIGNYLKLRLTSQIAPCKV